MKLSDAIKRLDDKRNELIGIVANRDDSEIKTWKAYMTRVHDVNETISLLKQIDCECNAQK